MHSTSKEAKYIKALYFDLYVNRLRAYYSKTNPNGGYIRIRSYLLQHDFVHMQYSGYHSVNKMTDANIFELVYDMKDKLPWLEHCMHHFEVANIGTDYDLMRLFDKLSDRPTEGLYLKESLEE